MAAGRLITRLAALAFAALTLAACAVQAKDQVYVGVDTQMPQPARARDYAALYAPYAMMATLAYTNPSGLDEAQHCPSYDNLGNAPPGESERDAEFRTTERRWLKDLKGWGWECRFGIYGNLKCPKMYSGCHPVSGLEFHIWRRMVNGHCEAVIAFRGTDKDDLGDWISNFRWFYRLVPKFDQYAQVQTHITNIVQQIKKHGCNGPGTQIVTAGHSLGGGLAQQAAYADANADIHYVYGFDPSPVTGFFDVSELLRKHSTEKLGVDRAFEAGEILALPRMIIENIFPPTACHPRIRIVRFNLLTGLPAAQHSIEELTRQLLKAAAKPGADPRRVDDSLEAQTCKGMPGIMVPPA
jgi:DUF2974 family protein